jgi:hypothetical protein
MQDLLIEGIDDDLRETIERLARQNAKTVDEQAIELLERGLLVERRMKEPKLAAR